MNIRRFFPVLAAAVLFAQEQPAPAPGPAPGGGGGGGGIPSPGGGGGGDVGAPAPGRTPSVGQPQQQQDPFGRNRNDPNQQRFPDMERPIFLSGKVVMDDGTPPPEPVQIERVCNGQPRPEAWTDSKRRFSFQLGQNSHLMADASVSSTDGFGSPPGGGGIGQGQAGGAGGFGRTGRGISERDLMGCELRASLAGYRSEIVNLSGRRMMDNPDVGTIILKPLANVEGKTFSMTTMMAPKDAKKAYEKGLDFLKKKKPAEAQKEFEKATTAYPKYAVAWHELGRIHEGSQRPAEARTAYQQALAADNRFMKPYLQLAGLSIQDQKWQELADTTDRIIRLNPVDYPQAYFFNSVANYNLQKFAEAEKSAAEAVKRDERHRWPKAQHLLGILLAMKDDYSGAAENIRGYLKFAPDATDADAVKKQLTDIEKRLEASQAAQRQQQ